MGQFINYTTEHHNKTDKFESAYFFTTITCK